MRFAVLPLAFGLALPAAAQHEHHHHVAPPPADSVAWRMVPMPANMPMMPGMESLVPPTAPWLPGLGIDPMQFPEAEPRQVVRVEDGDTLDLTASIVRKTIAGKPIVMFGYNRQIPGPLLRAERGSKVIVRFTNDIEMPTTVHWHGLRHDWRFDGVPGVGQAPVERKESFTYELRFPDTGIFWYHPHIREDVQQDLGMYGNMLVDPESDAWYAPANREEVVILDDILVDEYGLLPYGDDSPTHALMGRFGNVMLVNGDTAYRLEVDRGEVVRFFLTNVANSRTFNVVFGGAPIKVVASDVSKFEREVAVRSVVIAPAERYVVDVLFDRPGTYTITNTIQAVDHFRGEFFPHVDTLGAVTVSGREASPSFAASFADLRVNTDVSEDIDAFRPHFDRAPDRRLELTLRHRDLPQITVAMMEMDTLYVSPAEFNDPMPEMNWLSTSKQVEWILRDLDTGRENMDIDWRFGEGEVVKIRLFNNPKSFHPMNHPFHIHGQRFLVLDVDGVRNTNLVWKDTAIVPVGSTVDFLVDMSNPGKWMAHCHIAEHLHSGMMLGFEVGDPGTH